MTNDTFMMIFFPATTLLLGLICAILTKKHINTWYNTLKKPRFTPPNWIFSPVWSLLYISIGISGYLFWKEDENFLEKTHLTAWILYFTQLFLNYSWVFFFFSFHRLFLSLILSFLLDIIIIMNIIVLYSINNVAAVLLIPYLVWVIISTYYAFNIWRLNRFDSGERKQLNSLVEM